ncbi:MAG: toxin-antitoxin system HicB family antitoxin [Candidatus Caenarcaniphilales bacterium]|nr:toxin-antitoxin system HicB family antitoxin [Candidatus Caenarcaniphilales bacterium]
MLKKGMSAKFSKDSVLSKYHIKLSFDEEDKTWYAEIEEDDIDVIGHGKSPEEAIKCLSLNLHLYLEALESPGDFSGRLNLRLNPAQHALIYKRAKEQSKSINSYIVNCIEQVMLS